MAPFIRRKYDEISFHILSHIGDGDSCNLSDQLKDTALTIPFFIFLFQLKFQITCNSNEKTRKQPLSSLIISISQTDILSPRWIEHPYQTML